MASRAQASEGGMVERGLSFWEALRVALSGSYLRRALVVMFGVGSLLNLINQGDALFHGHPLNIPKLLLTYAVPFCVATYGAASALTADAAPGRAGRR